MVAGFWETIRAAYAAEETLGGLATIIVVSLIAIVAFVWIFRETGRRE